MASDMFGEFRTLLTYADFGRNVDNLLGSVRHAEETREETFRRVLELAKALLCPECRGRGRTPLGDYRWQDCPRCKGAGQRKIKEDK